MCILGSPLTCQDLEQQHQASVPTSFIRNLHLKQKMSVIATFHLAASGRSHHLSSAVSLTGGQYRAEVNVEPRAKHRRPVG